MKIASESVELTRANSGQSAALTALAFAAKASHGYHAEWLDRWRADLTVPDGYLQSYVVWTARVDGELAGWGVTIAWGRRCRLEHLWIAPAHQRQGIGRKLLAHLAVEARAAGWMELEILSDPFAAEFYQRCGARRVGEEPQTDGRRLPFLILPL